MPLVKLWPEEENGFLSFLDFDEELNEGWSTLRWPLRPVSLRAWECVSLIPVSGAQPGVQPTEGVQYAFLLTRVLSAAGSARMNKVFSWPLSPLLAHFSNVDDICDCLKAEVAWQLPIRPSISRTTTNTFVSKKQKQILLQKLKWQQKRFLSFNKKRAKPNVTLVNIYDPKQTVHIWTSIV